MTDYARPIGPRWYGCMPDEHSCMTCGRIKQNTSLRTVMPGDGVYRGTVPWVECVDRDQEDECASVDTQ